MSNVAKRQVEGRQGVAFLFVPATQRLPLCACGKRRENHLQMTRTAILKGSLSESNNEDMEHQFWGERASLWMNVAPLFRSTNVRLLHSCSAHVLSLRSGLCCRLLVGAPRAKSLGGQKSAVTGGLYRCDMNRNDCSRIDFDNSGEGPADTCAFFSQQMLGS